MKLTKLTQAARDAKRAVQEQTKKQIGYTTEKAVQDIAEIVTIDDIRDIVSRLVFDVVELTKEVERL